MVKSLVFGNMLVKGEEGCEGVVRGSFFVITKTLDELGDAVGVEMGFLGFRVREAKVVEGLDLDEDVFGEGEGRLIGLLSKGVEDSGVMFDLGRDGRGSGCLEGGKDLGDVGIGNVRI